jgi:hypothetical protein
MQRRPTAGHVLRLALSITIGSSCSSYRLPSANSRRLPSEDTVWNLPTID